MSQRKQRKSSVIPKKKTPREFAFQAYPKRDDIREAIEKAAEKRGWGVSQYLIFMGLKGAKDPYLPEEGSAA